MSRTLAKDSLGHLDATYRAEGAVLFGELPVAPMLRGNLQVLASRR